MCRFPLASVAETFKAVLDLDKFPSPQAGRSPQFPTVILFLQRYFPSVFVGSVPLSVSGILNTQRFPGLSTFEATVCRTKTLGGRSPEI